MKRRCRRAHRQHTFRAVRAPSWLLALLIAPAAFLHAGIVFAEDHPRLPFATDWNSPSKEERAAELLEKANTQYQQGNLRAAHQAFLAAWYLTQLASIAGALASLETELGLYAQAAEHWEFFLNETPPGQTEARAEAEAKLDALKRHVGVVNVTTDHPARIPTAEVIIHRVITDHSAHQLGPAPQRVWLEPGSYTFHARYHFRHGPNATVTIQPGDEKSLTVTFSPPRHPAPKPAPAPVTTDSSASRRGWSNQRQGVVAGGITLTVGSLGIGIIFTALSNDDGGSEPLASFATGAFIASGVFGAATLATAFYWWPWDEAEQSVSVRPWLDGPVQGVRVGGAF